MLSQPVLVDGQLFLGRVEEQKQFRAALQEVIAPPPDEVLPYVFLLYGDGGSGKTSLAKRFRDIAETDPQFQGRFQVLWLDWEDERKKFAGLQVRRDEIAPETIFQVIHAVSMRNKWGRQFSAYKKSINKQADVNKKVAEVLTSYEGEDEWGWLLTLGTSAIARLIRYTYPMIGEPGQQIAQTILKEGVQIGAEKIKEFAPKVETYLQARLNTDYYSHFLNPYEQLAEAIARGLQKVSSKRTLIVFLDSYETVDRADIWVRAIMQAAGPNVVWVISGQSDLVRSRQFGREYFKGYADDYPRRLLTYHMRPMALQDIQIFFNKHAPKRPLNEDETALISRATRGIPLALQTAADMWQANASLEEIVGNPYDTVPGDHIVQQMTDRYLQHVVAESDRIALYSLTLARGDVEILRTMLKPEESRRFDLNGRLRQLERDYASVHANRARLHDDPATFLRHYLKASVRRTSPRVRTLNEKAVAVLRKRLSRLEIGLETLDEQCQDENWCQAVSDLAFYLFWLDETDAWHWLAPHFVAGLVYNPSLCSRLLRVIGEWEEWLSQSGQHLFAGLKLAGQESISIGQIKQLIESLDRLDSRGWLTGNGEQERQAILELYRGYHQFWDGAYTGSLTHFATAANKIPQGDIILRQHWEKGIESLVRQALWPTPELVQPGSEERQEILRQARALLPAGNPILAQIPQDIAINESIIIPAAPMLSQIETLPLAGAVSSQPVAPPAEPEADLERPTPLSTESAPAATPLATEPLTPIPVSTTHFTTPATPTHIVVPAAQEMPPTTAPQPSKIIQPPSPDHWALAKKAHAAGQLDEALERYQAALSDDPTNPTLWLDLGTVQQQLRQFKQAQQSYTQCQLLAPKEPAGYEKAAALYVEQGDLRAARAIYRAGVRQIPRNLPLLFALGALYDQQKKGDEALQIYQRIIQLDPNNQAAYHALGNQLLHLEKPAAAVRLYQRLLTRHPQDAAGFARLGQALEGKKDFAQAVQAYKKACRLDPANSDANGRLAELYMQVGHPAKALPRFKQALQIMPHNVSLLKGIGEAYTKLEQWGKAVPIYEQLLQIEPANESLVMIIGNIYERLEQREKAAAHYRSFLQLQPDNKPVSRALTILEQPPALVAITKRQKQVQEQPQNPQSHFYLGEAFAADQQWAPAAAAYQQAVKIAPGYAPAYRGLGDAFKYQKKYDHALAAYQRAITLDPNLPAPHYGIGCVYIKQNQPKVALSAYKKTLRLKPDHLKAYDQLARIYLQLSMPDEALKTYQKGLQYVPNAVTLLLGLGDVYLAEERIYEAQAAYQKARDQEPENSAVHVRLARLNLHRGQTKEAQQIYEQALLLTPDSVKIHQALGDLHRENGRFKEAATYYGRVLELAPDNRQACQELGELHFQDGHMDQARTYWLHLKKLNPKSADAHYGLARINEEEGRIQLAIQQYTITTDIAPNFVPAYMAAGQLYFELEQANEAEQAFRNALKYNPSIASAYYWIGQIFAGLQKNADAVNMFKRARQLEPENDEIYSALATVYNNMGNYKKAIQVCRKALKLNPANSAANAILGHLWHLSGNIAKAMHYYQKALQYDSEDILTRASLAGLYRQMGNQKGFESEVAKVQNEIADLNEYNQACFAALCGNTNEALKLLKTALDGNQVKPEVAQKDPDLRFIQQDVRFAKIIKEAMFPN